MRYTQVYINGRNVASDKSERDPEVAVIVDGKPVHIGEIPKAAYPDEPEQIGSQIKGVSMKQNREMIYTKIAPDAWIALWGKDTYGRALADQARWSELAVYEVVNPKPEKPKEREPKGLGAVVEAICPGCTDSALHCRLNGVWFCDNCETESLWERLQEPKLLKEGYLV